MCTALTYKGYMGRNLDYDFSYGDEVTITPRNYVFDFKYRGKMESHFAIIGMACV
ncbi:MAG: linear amide C-N hydrolase, partial [Erysipelotrichaceae bacterium]|nr:linear amide C-N hydrolase [Erysipelotrichaceae bacterium]